MTTNVQRLIIMTVSLSLMLFLVSAFYQSAGVDYTGERDEGTRQMQNISEDFWNTFMDTNPDVGSAYLEQQVGDAKRGGSTVWAVLKGGVVGMNEAPSDADWIEIELISWLNWVIRIINILLALEIFYMLYSKKVS